MNNRKRNVQIKFRVTEEECGLIEEKMKQVPTSNMEAYLRKMAIDGYIIQIDHSDIKKMTAELQKIGVNINQIAKRANATGNMYQEDIEEIKGALKEIWRLQRRSRTWSPRRKSWMERPSVMERSRSPSIRRASLWAWSWSGTAVSKS